MDTHAGIISSVCRVGGGRLTDCKHTTSYSVLRPMAGSVVNHLRSRVLSYDLRVLSRRSFFCLLKIAAFRACAALCSAFFPSLFNKLGQKPFRPRISDM